MSLTLDRRVRAIARTEVAVAADAAARILESGLLPKTGATVKALAQAVGVEVQELQKAWRRVTDGEWSAPSYHPVVTSGVTTTGPCDDSQGPMHDAHDASKASESGARYIAHESRSSAMSGSPQNYPAGCCQQCGKKLPPPRGPGRPKKYCGKECRAESMGTHAPRTRNPVTGKREHGNKGKTPPNKKPEGDTRVCINCKEELPIFLFQKRTDANSRRSICDDCRKDYQRQRYVRVGYKVVTVEVADGDFCVGHDCPRCGQPFEVGQKVQGDDLHHEGCA